MLFFFKKNVFLSSFRVFTQVLRIFVLRCLPHSLFDYRIPWMLKSFEQSHDKMQRGFSFVITYAPGLLYKTKPLLCIDGSFIYTNSQDYIPRSLLYRSNIILFWFFFFSFLKKITLGLKKRENGITLCTVDFQLELKEGPRD